MQPASGGLEFIQKEDHSAVLQSGHVAHSMRSVLNLTAGCLLTLYTRFILFLTHHQLTFFWRIRNISLLLSRPTFTCGGNITGESGVIGSQGYPGVYPPNTKCVWRITVSSTFNMSLCDE